MKPSQLPVAVRAHIVPPASTYTPRAKRESPPKWGEAVVVFDTETTIDPSQRLVFGSYRQAEWQPDGTLRTAEEGLFYADDLGERDPAAFKALQTYARKQRQDVTGPGIPPRLRLLSRAQFVTDVLWPAAQGQDLIVGFNLPFDLSRLAVRWGTARRPPGWKFDLYQGGFSLALWEDEFRPRLCIRHVTSTITRIGFRHDRQHKAEFAGLFLDLAVLSRALTDKKHSLAGACEAFGVEHGKVEVTEHGVVTSDYIAYNRRDTQATLELLEKLRAEYDRHPIPVPPTRAFSAASIAKGYLKAAGMSPLRQREQVVPPERLGQAMSAFFGGRAECRIRRTAVPVVCCDVLSMYPTVQALLGIRNWLAAESLEVQDWTEEAQALLDGCTSVGCLDPGFWKHLNFFAEIEPDDDILPVRARYRLGNDAYNIGVNPLTCGRPLWYAGPSLVAATLLGGRPPRVRQAWRLVPHGQHAGLQPIKLRGQLDVDPRTQDLFRRVIELRKSPASQADPRLGKFLKVLANSGSYGINVEVNINDAVDGPQPVDVYGPGAPFRQDCVALEQPGDFYFPPIASLITAAAHLVLAILETEVRRRGGQFAFCDTDSMAIVATPKGGLVACVGGPERLPDGTAAIRALSFAQVKRIQRTLDRLKPYDLQLVTEPLLKIEPVNYVGDRLVGVECFAVAAKRYALFRRDADGQLDIVRGSEHGLGHLLNPRDRAVSGTEGTTWFDAFWRLVLGRALGLEHEEPAWLDRPAVTRFAVTSPHDLDPVKDRLTELRPFNFALVAHVAPFGHPAGSDPTHFQLVRGFTRMPSEWLQGSWVDRYSGRAYDVTTDRQDQRPDVVRLKTYRDVLEAYERHPEAKSLSASGEPCGPLTAGLLARRPIEATRVLVIGKESHRLEEVTDGLVQDWSAVQQGYEDPTQDLWRTAVLPLLKLVPKARVARAAGVSSRAIQAIRNGKAEPNAENRVALVRIAVTEARRLLRRRATPPEERALAQRLLGLHGVAVA